MKAKLFCLAAIVSLATVPASATTILITVTGTTTNNHWWGVNPSAPSYDQLGLFFGDGYPDVNARASLPQGTPFTISIITDIASSVTAATYETASGLFDATVTLNGRSATMSAPGTISIPVGTGSGWISASMSIGYSQPVGLSGYYTGVSFLNYLNFDFQSLALPTSLATPLRFTADGVVDGEVGFQSNPYWQSGYYYPQTQLYLHPETIEIIPVNAVPIPNVGAGLPGLIAAVSLFGWWRARRKGRAASKAAPAAA